MSVYQATVDPAVRNSSHTLMLELVGHDREVLDVGCASGYLAEALGKNGCLVSGIEYDPEEAEKARPFLVELAVADLNVVDLADQLPDSSFDVIVFGDVLEHLLDPTAVLRSALRLLRPDGSVVISIPNVSHGSVRLSLLQGTWKYTDTGLLDRTHIRFFTLDTLLEMLGSVGLTVTELRSTVADPLATEVVVDETRLPADAVDWVRNQPNTHDYQFVLSATRVDSEQETDHVRTAVPSMSLPPVRDLNTEIAELREQLAASAAQLGEREAELAATRDGLEEQKAVNTALRRAVLTSRDHAIGSEARVGRLRAEIGGLRLELHNTRLDAIHAHSELAKSIKDAQTTHARLAEALHRLRMRENPLNEGSRTVARSVRKAVGPRMWRLMTAPSRPFVRSRGAQK